MNINEVLKKVKQIELKTLRKTNALFLGEYHSSFKGRGMTFSEVRPYQYGDDVRNIDWNKTARFQEPFVKIFEEERELTMMLMVDVSASMKFGTQQQTKRETAAEISATLGFSALKNNDKVGLILFSDKIHLFLPPKKGKSHILRMIREIINFKAEASVTDFNPLFDFYLKTIKRKSIAFIISDFPNDQFKKNLEIMSKKHDVTGIKLNDEREKDLPNLGFMKFKDLETGKTILAHTQSAKFRQLYSKNFAELNEKLKKQFLYAQAGFIELEPQDNYANALMKYFQMRPRK